MWNSIALAAASTAILLRNVLIDFDLTWKTEVLSRTQQRMRPGSFLFLGGTETRLNVHSVSARGC